MAERRFSRLRAYGTGLALLAELGHLAWEHFHGGVRRHHLLHRADLPSVSNGWGLLLLPALAWYLIGRIDRRRGRLEEGRPGPLRNSVIMGFAGALLFGLLLSGCFTFRYETWAGILFQGLFLLALVLPVYRAECVLGFVVGMTFVFGAVLPTAIASLLAGFSLLVHVTVHPLLVRGWGALKRRGMPKA